MKWPRSFRDIKVPAINRTITQPASRPAPGSSWHLGPAATGNMSGTPSGDASMATAVTTSWELAADLRAIRPRDGERRQLLTFQVSSCRRSPSRRGIERAGCR